MFTNRCRFGIFTATLTAAAALSLGHTARAQTFTVETITPPAGGGSAKIKDISDDKSLIVQLLDSRDQVREDFFIPFSMATGVYGLPTSLSAPFGLIPGGLEQNGRFAVGNVSNQATALDLMTMRPQTIHPAGFRDSFINVAQNGYGAGWVRQVGGTKHAAEWGIRSTAIPVGGVVNDLHPSLVQSLGPDFLSSELLGIQTGNGWVGWGERRSAAGHHALKIAGGVWTELHPSSFAESEAVSILDQFQAGWGRDSMGLEHALVWQGTAGSAVSLNPSGYGNSRAKDMAPDGIVGYGKLANVDRATFWKRVPTAPNGFLPMDLHQFVPANAINSIAMGITGNGDIAGHFQTSAGWTPVVWHPIHLTGMTLSQTFIRGGSNVIGRVYISRPAPTGGVVINVGPRNGLFARTQFATVTVPEGQTQASFNILTDQVFSRVRVSISASLGYEQFGAALTLDPFGFWF